MRNIPGAIRSLSERGWLSRVHLGAWRGRCWAIGFGCASSFLVYNIVYLFYSSVPGNNSEYPLGWWGWFDQGQYLTAATAFLNGDFSPSQHFYPPLYPFLGSLFLRLSESHAFYLPNLALAVGYFAVLVMLFGRYIGWWGAAACGLSGMFLYEPFRLQWVIPWTTTLGAFLIICALFLLDRYVRRHNQDSWTAGVAMTNAVLFGLVVGLQAPLRPADLALVAPIAAIYAVLLVYALLSADRNGRRGALAAIVGGAAGFLVPVGLMLLFNSVTYGSIAGGYFSTVTSIGFDPHILPDRLFSHLLASQIFFGEQDADWLSVVPLVFAATVFLPIALFTGPIVMRAAAAAACVQFVIYFSYSDLLPTGTFRYFNIHYFKWLAPVALCIALYFVRQSFSRDASEKGRGRTAVAAGLLLVLVVSSVDAGQQLRPASLIEREGQQITLDLGDEKIDFVDFVGVEGGWTDVYFPGSSRVFGDGNQELTVVADYRFLPIKSGTRLLFFKPLNGGGLKIEFSETIPVPDRFTSANVRPVDVVYRMGFPLGQQASPAQISDGSPGQDLILSGETVVFEDWSVFEGSHRWSEGAASRVILYLLSSEPNQCLSMDGFTLGAQTISASVGGEAVSETRLDGQGTVTVPLGRAAGKTEIDLAFSNPHAPNEADTRSLAFAVEAMSVAPCP
ncbi:hypothetical protein GTW51_14540 [Aurantimonas aggregata]|uniref:Uncharacterized protein n=1 Tax=Aurantimonas aggregata TaxID=2047720 RepID=A0A6L9MJK5_9HYPH|nr:hypothetical protein [Aurantimonas aggregata]NDV87921.1 hypothetical protein [Aurantimonas aggregata]